MIVTMNASSDDAILVGGPRDQTRLAVSNSSGAAVMYDAVATASDWSSATLQPWSFGGRLLRLFDLVC